MGSMPTPSPDRIEQHPAVVAARAAEMRFHREHSDHALAWFALEVADGAHRAAVLAGRTPTAELERALESATHAYHDGTNRQVRLAFGRILEANIDAWDAATAALTNQDTANASS